MGVVSGAGHVIELPDAGHHSAEGLLLHCLTNCSVCRWSMPANPLPSQNSIATAPVVVAQTVAYPPPETALPAYEDWQDRENQRNPKGLISRLWRWVKR